MPTSEYELVKKSNFLPPSVNCSGNHCTTSWDYHRFPDPKPPPTVAPFEPCHNLRLSSSCSSRNPTPALSPQVPQTLEAMAISFSQHLKALLALQHALLHFLNTLMIKRQLRILICKAHDRSHIFSYSTTSSLKTVLMSPALQTISCKSSFQVSHHTITTKRRIEAVKLPF